MRTQHAMAGNSARMRSGRRSLRSALRIPLLLFLFGGLWGVAQGIWLVAPTLVRRHSIAPTRLSEWLVLESALVVGSAGLGVLLSMFAGCFILIWPVVRGRTYREPAWALGLALAPVLPLAYLALALLLEWKFFARIPPFAASTVAAAAGMEAAVAAAVAIAYRRMTAGEARTPVRTMARLLGVASVLGVIALPLRLPSPPPPSADGGPLVAVTGRAPTATPLLLVGIDSGNWQTIRPLLARGSLPSIARLIADGVHGDIEALWPPYWSGPAWAAILTGHPREEVGVNADLTVRARGLPLFEAPLDGGLLLDPFFAVEWELLRGRLIEAFPPPRDVLRRPPIWELLSRAGVETGVVRFDFTYPAGGQGSFVISNRVGQDAWKVAHVTPAEERELVAPAALQKELLAPFSDEVPFDERSFAALLPGPPRPRTPLVALEIEMLRTALDIDERTIAAAERILQLRPDLPFLAVYLGGFDNVCHAFWSYRFPEDYGDARPSQGDVDEFHPVIDRYLELLDRGLSRLIAAYSSRPNVIVLSDHGHGAISDDPLWRGWHARFGIFIGEGPAFPRRDAPLAVSYYDIVPTVADVMGFAVPKGMHGSSVLRR